MEGLTKERVLASVVAHTPKTFWADMAVLIRQTYRDSFQQVRHDSQILPEQKLDALLQYRHFRMERLLVSVAKAHGLAASATVLSANNRAYVLVGSASFVATQAYLPSMNDICKPARFREELSAINEIWRGGRLELGDQPAELLRSKDFFGIICHNPIGHRFEESLQALGMLQFCVPETGCKDWLARASIQEILSAYDSKHEDKRTPRELPWKEEVVQGRKRRQ